MGMEDEYNESFPIKTRHLFQTMVKSFGAGLFLSSIRVAIAVLRLLLGVVGAGQFAVAVSFSIRNVIGALYPNHYSEEVS